VTGKEVRIEHCPTEHMLGDFFTKPVQGALFKKFRNLIMNIEQEGAPSPDPATDHRSVLNTDTRETTDDDDSEREGEDLDQDQVQDQDEDVNEWIRVNRKVRKRRPNS
jgi:hypothetical protein